MADKILQSELVIKASDKTGRVFDTVAAKVDRLAAAGRHIDGVGAQFSRARGHVDALGRGLDALHSRFVRLESAGRRLSKVLEPISGVAASVTALEGAKLTGELSREAIKAGAEGAHERTRMEASGMTPAEMKEAEDAAARMTGKFKPVSQTTILHLLRNARSIVGTYEEAEKIIEPLLKTYVVAMGAHPQHREELETDFDQLVKGMEIKGVTQDMATFERYLNGMSKALNVFGDTLRPTDYYEMFKYGRQATQNLSEKFMLETAPTFAQELGGASAGNALATFYQTIVGGRMKDVAARELAKYDLLDPAKIVRTKTGAVKGVLPGGVKEARLAASDPYAWVNQVLLPALAEKGVTEKDQIQDVVAGVFRDRTAAQLVGILATQQSRIQKDWGLIEHAKGSEAFGTFMSKDPFVAMHGVTEQFTNLLLAASSPLAQPAADGLNALANALNALFEAAGKHPTGAAAALLGVTGAAAAGSAYAGWWGLGKAARLFKANPEAAPQIGEVPSLPQGAVSNTLKARSSKPAPIRSAGCCRPACSRRRPISSEKRRPAKAGTMPSADTERVPSSKATRRST